MKNGKHATKYRLECLLPHRRASWAVNNRSGSYRRNKRNDELINYHAFCVCRRHVLKIRTRNCTRTWWLSWLVCYTYNLLSAFYGSNLIKFLLELYVRKKNRPHRKTIFSTFSESDCLFFFFAREERLEKNRLKTTQISSVCFSITNETKQWINCLQKRVSSV